MIKHFCDRCSEALSPMNNSFSIDDGDNIFVVIADIATRMPDKHLCRKCIKQIVNEDKRA